MKEEKMWKSIVSCIYALGRFYNVSALDINIWMHKDHIIALIHPHLCTMNHHLIDVFLPMSHGDFFNLLCCGNAFIRQWIESPLLQLVIVNWTSRDIEYKTFCALVSDPGWLQSRWLEKVPGIPGAYAARNFTYLARDPFAMTSSAAQEWHGRCIAK